jgi:cytochrome c-type biogenesis protein CcmH/NrfG
LDEASRTGGRDGVPLLGLGDVYRQRRRTSQARAAYEEAIRAATKGGDRQLRARALAG